MWSACNFVNPKGCICCAESRRRPAAAVLGPQLLELSQRDGALSSRWLRATRRMHALVQRCDLSMKRELKNLRRFKTASIGRDGSSARERGGVRQDRHGPSMKGGAPEKPRELSPGFLESASLPKFHRAGADRKRTASANRTAAPSTSAQSRCRWRRPR